MAQQLTTAAAAGPRLVALAEVQRFVRECVAKAGAPDAHASAMASVLAEADRRGHFSHGLNRLDVREGSAERRVRRRREAACAARDAGHCVGGRLQRPGARRRHLLHGAGHPQGARDGRRMGRRQGKQSFRHCCMVQHDGRKGKYDRHVFHQHFTSFKPNAVKTGGAGHEPAVGGGAGGGRRFVRAGHGHDGRRGGQDRGEAAPRGAHPRRVGAGRERRRHHRRPGGHERGLPHAAGRLREHLRLQGLRPRAHGGGPVRRARRGGVRAGRAQVDVRGRPAGRPGPVLRGGRPAVLRPRLRGPHAGPHGQAARHGARGPGGAGDGGRRPGARARGQGGAGGRRDLPPHADHRLRGIGEEPGSATNGRPLSASQHNAAAGTRTV